MTVFICAKFAALMCVVGGCQGVAMWWVFFVAAVWLLESLLCSFLLAQVKPSSSIIQCNSFVIFFNHLPRWKKKNIRKRDIFLWPCDSLWGRYWVCKSNVWAFISFVLWCFVVLTQWLLLSNNHSSIASTTLPCQEPSMPTRPSQILQQTTNTQSSLWEKKGPMQCAV